jgi:hypothetical protein
MVAQARRLLASPRRRRRLIALLVVLLAATVVGLLVAFERNTAKSTATPVTKGKPFVPAPQPKSRRFTKTEAKVVLPVAMRFVRDAVGRHDMHSAWEITAPVLRADTSRKDWDRGENTEVPPFDVDHARWRIDYNYPKAVGLEVAVFPTKTSEIKNPMVYYMELQKQRVHGHSSWLVDQWVPAPGSAQVVQGNLNPLAGDRSTPPPQGLGAVWLAVPAGIILLILAIPLTLGVREWRRSRRARRGYDSGLPPLSQYGSGNR